MGNCLSIEVKLCDVHLHLEEIGSTCCSRSKIEILREKMDDLRALKTGVEEKIQSKRNSQVEVSSEVKTWVEKVSDLDKKVSKIIASHQHRRRYVCSEFGIRSKIDCVEEMIKQKTNWKDSIFIEKPKTYALECLPRNIVGMKQVMSQVLLYVDDVRVGVIGINGMGGAGKTTLANQLIKILSSSPSTSAAARGQESMRFDVIIWAVVSHNLDIGKLQNDIAVELGIHKRSEFKDEEDLSIRARFISSYLSQKRFLLVLDDVWEKFDLTSIGIPELDDGKKIVLTTRKAKVCTDMDARRSTVKVGCLGEEESWELFKKTIQWNDGELEEKGIYKIARDIARKCGGLPLALITIARAMATKSDISLWRRAYELLKDSPHNIEGMEDVYKLLEFSYDSLKKEEYKSCLLYIALFPEDEEIRISRMVDYCIGGGSVSVDRNMSPDIVSLRYEGRFIISELIDACLLERGKDEEHVRVHDAIRDMILNWIRRQNSWSRIVSVSMLLPLSHNRPRFLFQANNLQVLLLNGSTVINEYDIYKLEELFSVCLTLRVLDLSSTGLQQIPLSLCSLKLLQYFNLSNTRIKALPEEMGNLRNLLLLDLSFTEELQEIPNGLLSSLSKLQSLHLFYCAFGMKSLRVLEEMGRMRLLQDVSLFLRDDVDAVKFIVEGPDSLSNSIKKLDIQEMDIFRDGLFKRMGSRLKNLELFSIRDGNCKEDLVIDDGHFSELHNLLIYNAGSFGHIILKGQALKDLTSLTIWSCDELKAPPYLWKLANLKELSIEGCNRIVELIEPTQLEGSEIIHDQAILPKLERIKLGLCPNLQRLSTSPVKLHSLKSLGLFNLKSLKDISTINSPHEVVIRCGKKWWEDLQWENYEGVPPPNFIPILYE